MKYDISIPVDRVLVDVHKSCVRFVLNEQHLDNLKEAIDRHHTFGFRNGETRYEGVRITEVALGESTKEQNNG